MPPGREPAATPVLTCPYTGATLVLTFVPWASAYTFVGGFDPAAWHEPDELERAVRAASRGLLRCPYKGTPVTLLRSGSLARAEGAFSPAQLWARKEHALYDVSVRGGVPPAFGREPKESKIVVGYERRRESDPTVGLGANSAYVDTVVKDILT